MGWLCISSFMMKLLIVGATGPTGREITSQALTQGHAVTALVRDAAKATFAPSVSKAVGDVLDVSSLEKALAGQEAVICSLGSAMSGPFKKMTLLSEGTRNLVAAMKAQGVSRLICITGIGAGESLGHGPWYYNWLFQPLMLRGVYHDKTHQEEIVRASGLDWTLVRPAILTNGPAKGATAVNAFTQMAGVHVGTISRPDVAAFCLQELVDKRYQRQAPVIAS
jgi:putative NADH-flavin reductase